MDGAESKNAAGVIDIDDPEKALIDVRETGTVIITANENLASHIFKAIDIVLDGIWMKCKYLSLISFIHPFIHGKLGSSNYFIYDMKEIQIIIKKF